jgi:hypothetical protein
MYEPVPLFTGKEIHHRLARAHLLVARARMCEASPSSSANVLRPNLRQSLAPMRVYTPSNTLSTHEAAGTQEPSCIRWGKQQGAANGVGSRLRQPCWCQCR